MSIDVEILRVPTPWFLLADISKVATLLGYQPTHRICEGLKVAMELYVQHLAQQGKA